MELRWAKQWNRVQAITDRKTNGGETMSQTKGRTKIRPRGQTRGEGATEVLL